MRKTTILASMLLFLGSLSGCGGDTHESLVGQALELMNEYNTIMDAVKDDASAAAAKPKLEALEKRAADLKKRADALGKPSDDERKRLQEKFQAQMASAGLKAMASYQKQQQYGSLRGIDIMSKLK